MMERQRREGNVKNNRHAIGRVSDAEWHIAQLCRYLSFVKIRLWFEWYWRAHPIEETEWGWRGRQTWHGAERESEKLTPEGERETETRGRRRDRDRGEIIIWHVQQRSRQLVCLFSGHAASTVPLKVLFNNVNVPHLRARLLSTLNCFWPVMPLLPCTESESVSVVGSCLFCLRWCVCVCVQMVHAFLSIIAFFFLWICMCMWLIETRKLKRIRQIIHETKLKTSRRDVWRQQE